MSGESALASLSEATGRDFRNLAAARDYRDRELEDRRARLEKLAGNDDVAVVLMGSWGRAELTEHSDDDFMVLSVGAQGDSVRPSVDAVMEVLKQAPTAGGPFGDVVFCDNLVERIGLDHDDNANLTRRMLFLLESIAATNEPVYANAFERVLRAYLDESVKPYRVPRFLLNDVVRYWRTVCVDFAGKEREGRPKWGLRNAKLRLSRKVLFAGGLVPVLDASNHGGEEMYGYLRGQFALPPTERLAAAFLRHGAADPGARALGAYDDFLGRLGEREFRERLAGLTRTAAAASEEFAIVQRLGKELENGLLALLFETERLPKLVREVGIF